MLHDLWEINKSPIDLILINKSLSFLKTLVSKTGLGEYQKLISAFFKSTVLRLKAKIIFYRNHKIFDESIFFNGPKTKKINCVSKGPNEKYNSITTKFSKLINKHGLLKRNIAVTIKLLSWTKNFRKLFIIEID